MWFIREEVPEVDSLPYAEEALAIRSEQYFTDLLTVTNKHLKTDIFHCLLTLDMLEQCFFKLLNVKHNIRTLILTKIATFSSLYVVSLFDITISTSWVPMSCRVESLVPTYLEVDVQFHVVVPNLDHLITCCGQIPAILRHGQCRASAAMYVLDL